MKPWKSVDVLGRRDRVAEGFNGATAMKPWKSSRLERPVESMGCASMGPRR